MSDSFYRLCSTVIACVTCLLIGFLFFPADLPKIFQKEPEPTVNWLYGSSGHEQFILGLRSDGVLLWRERPAPPPPRQPSPSPDETETAE